MAVTFDKAADLCRASATKSVKKGRNEIWLERRCFWDDFLSKRATG
jgi:hypothetical protein